MSRPFGRNTPSATTPAGSPVPSHDTQSPGLQRPRRARIFRVVCLALEWMLRPVATLHAEGVLPTDGGLLLAPNHVSVIDPLFIGAAAVRAGRIPRFVTTAGVFRVPVVGAVLRYFDHIPLDRAATGGGTRLDPIRHALLAGECVVLYPEGHITRRPDYLPDSFRTGIVHLAAATATPVVPVAQWGPQHFAGRGRPAFLRCPPHRAQVHVQFGDPITLGETSSVAHAPRETARALRERIEQMVQFLPTTTQAIAQARCRDTVP